VGQLAAALAIGFGSGILSGMFGIGGGVLMVPAMRILLGVEGLTAVGTSLPVIIPSAITGAISYLRAGQADWRTGMRLAVGGAPLAVAGALLAEKAGGTVVLIVLACVVLWTAADTILQTVKAARTDAEEGVTSTMTWPRALGTGALTGIYSGFLGLGGGFIMVPLLTRFGKLSIKRAIGTSLIAICFIALPAAISHIALGNGDLRLTLMLALGIVPGALIGARITIGGNERAIRIGFAVMLVVTGVAIIAREAGWM
jgi:uncharacterized membrane protein YfcA